MMLNDNSSRICFHSLLLNTHTTHTHTANGKYVQKKKKRNDDPTDRNEGK
jgi:hypothetical protein